MMVRRKKRSGSRGKEARRGVWKQREGSEERSLKAEGRKRGEESGIRGKEARRGVWKQREGSEEEMSLESEGRK